MGFFDKIKAGLTKTRNAMANTVGSVFSGFSDIDDDFYDELEECLILADLGVETVGIYLFYILLGSFMPEFVPDRSSYVSHFKPP